MLNIMKIEGREGATTFIYTCLGTYLKKYSMEILNLFEQPFNSMNYAWKLDSVQINQFENYYCCNLTCHHNHMYF
jgi:hypothetical protein